MYLLDNLENISCFTKRNLSLLRKDSQKELGMLTYIIFKSFHRRGVNDIHNQSLKVTKTVFKTFRTER